MNPARHHELRRQIRWGGFLIGAVYFILYLVAHAVNGPSLVRFVVAHMTGVVVSPQLFELVNASILSVVLLLCWGVPSPLFRWFILPRCPRCGVRTRLVTESGVQYVCPGCNHCHDTGTMQLLAEAEGKAL